jgi:hypothetical protein
MSSRSDDRMTSEAGSSETETSTERVTAETARDGDQIGQMVVEVRAPDHRAEELVRLRAEKLTLRARVAELEERLLSM